MTHIITPHRRTLVLALAAVGFLASAFAFGRAAATMSPKGAVCNAIGCPDVGALECASTTVDLDTPIGGIEVSVTCYQDESGTGGPPPGM